MSQNDYDVIVVGGGISGLFSALALGTEGYKILGLEKEPYLGGNCRTYEVEKGYRVDTGPHAITEMLSGPITKLKKYFKPGMFPEFRTHENYYLRKRDGLEEFPSTLPGFLKMKALPLKDKIVLAEELVKSIISHAISEKEISVYDALSSRKIGEKTKKFVDALSYLLSGLSMEKTSVSRLLDGCGFIAGERGGILKRVRETFSLFNNMQYKSQGYPFGGIQSITDGVIGSFPNHVNYHKSEEVRQIEKNRNSFYVSTAEGTYSSDKVIFSGPVKLLPNIIDAEMPPGWMAQVNALEQSKTMTLWIGFDEPPKEFNYNGSEVFCDTKDEEQELFYWLMPVPELAPSNKGLIGISTIIGPGSYDTYEEKLLKTLYTLVPDAEKHVEMTHRQVMVPEKAAASLTPFPSVTTPVKGLYVVGTDTDMRSMGITRAGYSVLEMLNAMNRGK